MKDYNFNSGDTIELTFESPTGQFKRKTFFDIRLSHELMMYEQWNDSLETRLIDFNLTRQILFEKERTRQFNVGKSEGNYFFKGNCFDGTPIGEVRFVSHQEEAF